MNPEYSVHKLRVAMLRVHQTIGLQGMIGVVLCAAAVAWILLIGAWTEVVAVRPEQIDQPAEREPVAVVAASDPALILSLSEEQALLLTQVQQIVLHEGLSWDAANYKVLPAGDGVPIGLQVRCELKGPYPKLRSVLRQWLSNVPGLTLGDLSMSRKTGDLAEIEAKMVLVIFMLNQVSERAGSEP